MDISSIDQRFESNIINFGDNVQMEEMCKKILFAKNKNPNRFMIGLDTEWYHDQFCF